MPSAQRSPSRLGKPAILLAVCSPQARCSSLSATLCKIPPQALPAWVSGRPMVLVASAAAPPPAPSATWPDTAGARLVLAAPGQDFSMEVGPWMVGGNV